MIVTNFTFIILWCISCYRLRNHTGKDWFMTHVLETADLILNL